ncbi:hypothetical protein PAXRUDRAFT_360753 [Paxillus rubicundulus Ve08.2h10]|uniref:Uncharacterized protein n=1 Tax=Paxillus rubicundulus Ve08.2h10 TaxID=930991 RepID=A0A0D0EA79_9AGAM|nr:hypothetical protein PAXRUDRAFT_360753 [Paxillus rubicundulus Ve08.2h10]
MSHGGIFAQAAQPAHLCCQCFRHFRSHLLSFACLYCCIRTRAVGCQATSCTYLAMHEKYIFLVSVQPFLQSDFRPQGQQVTSAGRCCGAMASEPVGHWRYIKPLWCQTMSLGRPSSVHQRRHRPRPAICVQSRQMTQPVLVGT